MKLDIVIAVKNQTAKLLDHLENIGIPYFDSLGVAYDILIVSDHSDEPSQKALEEGMKKMPLQVKLLPYEDIPGKGHGVEKGILAATGDYVLFMDADFATDVHILDSILPQITHYDCFIASRHSKGSKILTKQSFVRRLTSWGARFIVRHKFHLQGIHDTQCGFKLFRLNVAKEMAKRQIINGFAFDVEYLYFLQLNGFSIKEIPATWTDDPSSTVSSPLKTSLRFYKDLVKIKKNKKNYFLSSEEKEELSQKKN